MQRFAEKLRDARAETGLSQSHLAEETELSIRSISAYETGTAMPRASTLRRLAKALHVSVEYLTNDEAVDPQAGLIREQSIENIRSMYGSRGVAEAETLLLQNRALFAGGTLSQEAKDAFFQAVMTAYVNCKEEARQTFGRTKDGE